MSIFEIVQNLGVGTVGIGTAAVLLTLIQIAPIQIRPWTYLAKMLGRAINGEVVEKVTAMDREVRDIRREIGEDRAINARVRILQFNDELLGNIRHSKEGFDQALDDITNYERYCSGHPEFPNDKTRMAVANIERCYQKCLEEHDFL